MKTHNKTRQRMATITPFGLVLCALTMLILVGCRSSGALVTVAKYRVAGDKILSPLIDQRHANVWQRFNALFPAEFHPEIVFFSGIDAAQSGGIDGALLTTDASGQYWHLLLDVTDSYGSDELDRTMMHEFFHLITSRIGQVRYGAGQHCTGYYNGIICAQSGSYLDDYVQRFWSAFDAAQINDQSNHAINKRFASGHFVTAYAATNPMEDIAETLTEWVLADNMPSDNSVIGRKMRFFNRYPKLVELRQIIRSGLAQHS